jgi:hypothetical protein
MANLAKKVMGDEFVMMTEDVTCRNEKIPGWGIALK